MLVASLATRTASSWTTIVRRFRVEADRPCLLGSPGNSRHLCWTPCSIPSTTKACCNYQKRTNMHAGMLTFI